MKLLQNAWGGGTTPTGTFTMQKHGKFSVRVTGDFDGEAVTMQTSPDGTNEWDTYLPDGVAETWGSGDEGDTRAFEDGPAWFRFVGDGNGTAPDLHIFVGGIGLTLNQAQPTYS